MLRYKSVEVQVNVMTLTQIVAITISNLCVMSKQYNHAQPLTIFTPKFLT